MSAQYNKIYTLDRQVFKYFIRHVTMSDFVPCPNCRASIDPRSIYCIRCGAPYHIYAQRVARHDLPQNTNCAVTVVSLFVASAVLSLLLMMDFGTMLAVAAFIILVYLLAVWVVKAVFQTIIENREKKKSLTPVE